jgi:lipopolysaccharide export system protein LptA
MRADALVREKTHMHVDQNKIRPLRKSFAPLNVLLCLLIFSILFFCTISASAKSSDRDQIMGVNSNESDCGLGDDEQCDFLGNVVITQGTLVINASKAVLHRLNGQSNRVVLTGNPVRLTQQLDNGSTFNAKAETIDYNLINETVVMTGNVAIDQPGRGSMSGTKLTYNLKTGRVESGGQGNGRVTVTIQPKSKQTPKPAPAPEKKP